MSGNELKQTLSYLREREEKLSRVSDKLRGAITRIAEMFGDPKACAVCGRRREAPPHGRYYDRHACRSTDELPPNAKVVREDEHRGQWGDPHSNTVYFEEVPEGQRHKFTPKIYISLPLKDTAWFWRGNEDEESTYVTTATLAFEDGELVAVLESGYGANVDTTVTKPLSALSREQLKALVRSGRLPAFLAYAAERLREAGEEYGEVAEVAERMAEATRPQDGRE